MFWSRCILVAVLTVRWGSTLRSRFSLGSCTSFKVMPPPPPFINPDCYRRCFILVTNENRKARGMTRFIHR